MEILHKFFNYFKSRKDILLLLWEKENGWIPYSGSCSIFDISYSEEISLETLNKLSHAEDSHSFRIFTESVYNEINGRGSSITSDESKISKAVRLKCSDGLYRYFNTECWIERENNQVCRLFIMIAGMDPTESYRVRISENFYGSCSPGLLNEQVTELVNNNPDKKFAVIQFDIVKFKIINEQYSEKTGDELLGFFTNTLHVICNSMQVSSRLSSDIFMVITSYETDKDIYDFIELTDRYLLGYKGMTYKIAYGVSYLTDISAGLRQYGDYAAMARQSVKDNALTHVAFYKEEIKQSLFTNKIIEDQMENALESGQFVMYLQPKFGIHNSDLIGAEALVRWIHPDMGIVPPVKFIPLFEKNGFIIKLDYHIWEEACKKIRGWTDSGKRPVPVSVNVSRRHLVNLDFITVLNNLTDKYNIPKELLEIEITESVDENMIEKGISILKKNGYTLLMDDFGSGYSSLNTLKNTQFDVIKLDKEFLNDFSNTDRGRDIVKYTVNLIQNIGMEVIAEGVETIGQAEFLEQCGCHAAQGYYYDKPLDSGSFDNKYMK